MSEKRFIVENDNNEVSIKDKVKDNYPFALAYEHIDDADNLIQECLSLVGLLNEQQSIIEHLTVEKFKENKRFTKLLSEQQATIKQLQDLCGESDSENAKLRIENEQLRQSVEYWQKKYEEGTETFQID